MPLGKLMARFKGENGNKIKQSPLPRRGKKGVNGDSKEDDSCEESLDSKLANGEPQAEDKEDYKDTEVTDMKENGDECSSKKEECGGGDNADKGSHCVKMDAEGDGSGSSGSAAGGSGSSSSAAGGSGSSSSVAGGSGSSSSAAGGSGSSSSAAGGSGSSSSAAGGSSSSAEVCTLA